MEKNHRKKVIIYRKKYMQKEKQERKLYGNNDYMRTILYKEKTIPKRDYIEKRS